MREKKMCRIPKLCFITFLIVPLLCNGEDVFLYEGQRAIPQNAQEIAVSGNNWYGIYTDVSNTSYLCKVNLETTNSSGVVMLSFPTNSMSIGGGDGGSTTISVDPDDATELASYGTFGTLGTAVVALVAAVAALHRRRFQQDPDGSYYFEVEESESAVNQN